VCGLRGDYEVPPSARSECQKAVLINLPEMRDTKSHALLRCIRDDGGEPISVALDSPSLICLHGAALTLVSFRSNISVLSIIESLLARTKSRARSPEKVDGFGPTRLNPSLG